MIDKGSNTCGDCSECKSDYEDHLLFHRANHISCKFCYNVSEHIPCSIFKTPQDLHKQDARVDASLFSHAYGYKEPKQDPLSRKFLCDKCEQRFSQKSDLKKHEVAQHYGKECPCSLCGIHFSREDNLQQHKSIHR